MDGKTPGNVMRKGREKVKGIIQRLDWREWNASIENFREYVRKRVVRELSRVPTSVG